MFVDGMDGLQHVLPVEHPFVRIHSFAVSQPCVQIQVSTLHQHVDVAVGYFTANTTVMVFGTEIIIFFYLFLYINMT